LVIEHDDTRSSSSGLRSRATGSARAKGAKAETAVTSCAADRDTATSMRRSRCHRNSTSSTMPLSLPGRRDGGSVLADLGTGSRRQLLTKLESVDQEIAVDRPRMPTPTRALVRRTASHRSGAATVPTRSRPNAGPSAESPSRRHAGFRSPASPRHSEASSLAPRPARAVARAIPVSVTAMNPCLPGAGAETAGSCDRSRGRVIAASGRARRREWCAPRRPSTRRADREVVLEVGPAHSSPGASVSVRLGGTAADRRRAPENWEDGYALVWENGHTALRAVTLARTWGGGWRS